MNTVTVETLQAELHRLHVEVTQLAAANARLGQTIACALDIIREPRTPEVSEDAHRKWQIARVAVTLEEASK